MTVSQGQANLPKLIRQDSFAIAQHGKVVGVFLSKDRIEALVESMELLGDPDFIQALKEHKAGRGKRYEVAGAGSQLAAGTTAANSAGRS